MSELSQDVSETPEVAGRAVVELVGDLEDPDAVRAVIEQASSGYTRPLRVDLSGVTYLPSMVVGVLFVALRSAATAGVELEVAVAPGTVAHNIALITAMPHVVS